MHLLLCKYVYKYSFRFYSYKLHLDMGLVWGGFGMYGSFSVNMSSQYKNLTCFLFFKSQHQNMVHKSVSIYWAR